MPRLEKFSKKFLQAFSSRNRTEEGVGSEEEVDATERREFWDETDFRLGSMMQLSERKRERDIHTKKSTKHINI